MAMFLARVVAGLAFLALAYWAYHDPKFESYGVAGTALAAFLALYIVPKLTGGQKQNVSGGSTGYQAGADINVGSSSKNVRK